MIRYKEFFYKNLRFHTRTTRDTLLIVSNMKFRQKLSTKCLLYLLLITFNWIQGPPTNIIIKRLKNNNKKITIKGGDNTLQVKKIGPKNN